MEYINMVLEWFNIKKEYEKEIEFYPGLWRRSVNSSR